MESKRFFFVAHIKKTNIQTTTGWWFQIFVIFTATWGDDPNLTNIFQMGWNHQLDKVGPYDRYKWSYGAILKMA